MTFTRMLAALNMAVTQSSPGPHFLDERTVTDEEPLPSIVILRDVHLGSVRVQKIEGDHDRLKFAIILTALDRREMLERLTTTIDESKESVSRGLGVILSGTTGPDEIDFNRPYDDFICCEGVNSHVNSVLASLMRTEGDVTYSIGLFDLTLMITTVADENGATRIGYTIDNIDVGTAVLKHEGGGRMRERFPPL